MIALILLCDPLYRSSKYSTGAFLRERGLELSPTKTVITHVEKGFDFLGQNVRKYPNGKLLIKPSKRNIQTFLGWYPRNYQSCAGHCLPPI
jgi:hypothetical protein